MNYWFNLINTISIYLFLICLKWFSFVLSLLTVLCIMYIVYTVWKCIFTYIYIFQNSSGHFDSLHICCTGNKNKQVWAEYYFKGSLEQFFLFYCVLNMHVLFGYSKITGTTGYWQKLKPGFLSWLFKNTFLNFIYVHISAWDKPSTSSNKKI